MQSDFGGTAPFATPVNKLSRGYVPYYNASGKTQMIAYRLADSWPREAIEPLEILDALPGLAAISNPIWQWEYGDRFIRDNSHFNKAVNYSHENPEKAGLIPYEEVAS